MKLSLFLLSAAAMVNAAIATDMVPLGTAGNYAILTKTGISTVPTSAVTGDMAVSPISATAITGFDLIMDSGGAKSSSTQVVGDVYASDYGTPTPSALTTAVEDMHLAYANAFGREKSTVEANNDLGGGKLGGKTLSAGVYTWTTTIEIGDSVTFDGSSEDVFILRTTGDLKQALATEVILTGDAKAENIFWQVAGAVTVGAGAKMQGVLLSKKAVTFITGSTLIGRVLSQTACALQSATITAE
jgi:hypothetical protein